MNLDNKLNKNLEYASSEKDPDSDKEIDNGFLTILMVNGLMKPYLKNLMMHLLT